MHFHLTFQRTLGTPYVSGHGQRHPRPRGRKHERVGDIAKQIGIEVKNPDNFRQLTENFERSGLGYEDITENEILANLII